MRPLRGLQETRVATREESGVKKKKAVTLADRRCGDTEQKPLSTKSRDVSQGFGLEAEV